MFQQSQHHMRVYIANGHRGAAVFCAPAALQWYRMIDASAKNRGAPLAPRSTMRVVYAKNDKMMPNSTKFTR
jgi:hypothetical protein